MLTLLFFFTLIFPQYNSQEWSSITSLLTPNGIVISDQGFVYSSTSGGLLKFNPNTNKFTFIKEEDGLVYLDLSSIAIDSNNRIWIGGAYPRGYLQVFDPKKGLVKEYSKVSVHAFVSGDEFVAEGECGTEPHTFEPEESTEGSTKHDALYTRKGDEAFRKVTVGIRIVQGEVVERPLGFHFDGF